MALAIAGTTIAGIQGSGIQRIAVIGTVETNDGLKVNGVTYDTTGARVVINGRGSDVSALHAGHVVVVKGKIASNGASGAADEVSLVSDVRGEITSVDPEAGTLEVLGQVVRVTDASVLAPGLQPGMFVNVSGFEQTDGSFLASSVEVDPLPDLAQVRAVVDSLDTAVQSLRIGNLTVDFSGAVVEGHISDGVIVTVRGVQPSGLNSLIAQSVEVFAGIGAEGERGDVEGIITAFASPSDFEINGQPVLADSKTVYVLHGVTLELNVAVRVKGRFDAAGVLIADKIQSRAPKAAKQKEKKSTSGEARKQQ